jgi:L,D-peptidoglycan transpeptidase YkuD (ErfK/YbiS/YcfS/YnhG family)
VTRRTVAITLTAVAVVAALSAITGVTVVHLRNTAGTQRTAEPPPPTVGEATPLSTSEAAAPSPSLSPSAAPSHSPSASPSKAPATKAPTTTAAGAQQVAADNVASRLKTIPAATRQVIVVHAAGFGSTSGTLETFNRTASGWQAAFGAMPARVGTKGFSDNKHEGDLTTPTGVYSIGGTMYGLSGNPGVRYGYHRLVADDWWNENPATPGYNTFVHGADPGGASEALWQVSPQYNYFAVINYNVPVAVADPPRGSGIFLHVMVSGHSTAGCVALAQADLVKVLTWLDPGASPRIVMAPDSALGRY